MTTPKTSPLAESVVEQVARALQPWLSGWHFNEVKRIAGHAVAAMPSLIEYNTPTDAGEAPFTRLVADYLPEGEYENQEPGWRIHDFPEGTYIANWLAGGLEEAQAKFIVEAVNARLAHPSPNDTWKAAHPDLSDAIHSILLNRACLANESAENVRKAIMDHVMAAVHIPTNTGLVGELVEALQGDIDWLDALSQMTIERYMVVSRISGHRRLISKAKDKARAASSDTAKSENDGQ